MKSLRKFFKKESRGNSKKKIFNKEYNEQRRDLIEKKEPLNLTKKNEPLNLTKKNEPLYLTKKNEQRVLSVGILSEKEPKEEPRNLWKKINHSKYRFHVTLTPFDSTMESEVDERTIYMDDLKKRMEVYGICGECGKPGTGKYWCQSCNAKRFRDNFKNWTSGNKNIDEMIQQSQLNAVHHSKCLEWIPFETFQNFTYVSRGGFGEIYSAKWPDGYIDSWDIENRKWERKPINVALKNLDYSSNISTDLLNEIKSYLQIYINDIVKYYGITRDPDTKDYMIVMDYCRNGSLRNYLNQSKEIIPFKSKILHLLRITRGLLDIHSTGKVHKCLHSGNILFGKKYEHLFISDIGMCQPANQSLKKEVYGVLPYIAPEVLREHQYTQAADIYSFGIVMNEFISEEVPHGDIPHDHNLAVKICQGLRPKISENTPKLFADLIMKCWDAKVENRPTANELLRLLRKWYYFGIMEIKESEIIGENSSNNKSKNIYTHPQAIYFSRPFNFKDLPNPVNSSDST